MAKRPSTSSKKAGYKPTGDELDERIEHVIHLLAGGSRKHEIKDACRLRYGVCARTTETYVARAREEIRRRVNDADRDELLGLSMAWWEDILRNPKAPLREKMTARERLDGLLGLNVPTEVKADAPELAPLVINIRVVTKDGDGGTGGGPRPVPPAEGVPALPEAVPGVRGGSGVGEE